VRRPIKDTVPDPSEWTVALKGAGSKPRVDDVLPDPLKKTVAKGSGYKPQIEDVLPDPSDWTVAVKGAGSIPRVEDVLPDPFERTVAKEAGSRSMTENEFLEQILGNKQTNNESKSCIKKKCIVY
jgi:hypothetical protein